MDYIRAKLAETIYIRIQNYISWTRFQISRCLIGKICDNWSCRFRSPGDRLNLNGVDSVKCCWFHVAEYNFTTHFIEISMPHSCFRYYFEPQQIFFQSGMFKKSIFHNISERWEDINLLPRDVFDKYIEKNSNAGFSSNIWHISVKLRCTDCRRILVNVGKG